MASPSVSAILNFVKKYPIVLCGFSLLFMPSVQRLLLYFTPLLLSTAIFVVAMMSWGPSTSSERGRRRSTHKVGHAWAFKKMDDDDEEEEVEDEEVEVDIQQEEISQKGNPIKDMQHEVISQKGKTSDPDLKLEAAELEPDPDLAEEGHRVGTVSNEAITLGQAAPDPDFQRDCAGAASNCGSPIHLGGQADADLQRDCAGAAPNCGSPIQLRSQAQRDPDLQSDCVGTASNSASAGPHGAEPDPDLHADQKAEPDPQLHSFPAAEHEHDPPTDHHLYPAAAADLHAQPVQMNHDQPAMPHRQDHQSAEESADDHHQLHAQSDAEHTEGDLREALRHKLGVIRKAPYTIDDPNDMELASWAAVERLEASLGISGSSSDSSHQRAPEYRLQALHAAA